MYDLNLWKDQLTQFLRLASMDQLFQFDGQLYEQCEGVAVGSLLGPLLVGACNFTLLFISSILTAQSDGFCLFARFVMLMFVAYVRKVLMSKLENLMPNCMKEQYAI